ncbi:MAG: hypothetical protein R3B07_11885 [Polyangiaceae bacterium]
MDPLVPLQGRQAVRSLLESLALATAQSAFAHHLSKGNIESWLALELAFQLDSALEPFDWTCLVDERRLDMLLVPRGLVKGGDRLSLSIGSAPAFGVEIREAKLAQGQSYGERAERLAQDLSKLGPAVHRFGVLLTTDAKWSLSGRPETFRSKQETKHELCAGLRMVARFTRQIGYRQFAGRMVVEVVTLDAPRGFLDEEVPVSSTEIASFAARAKRLLPMEVPVEEQVRLAASARAYYDQYAELPEAHDVLLRCLCFEQQKLTDVGRELEGDELRYHRKLYHALFS